MSLSTLLQGLRIEADLTAQCPYGTLLISCPPASNLLSIECSNGRVFRYLLRTAAALASLAAWWRWLQSGARAGQAVQIRVAGRTLLRIGAGERKLRWAALLGHWLQARLGR